MNNTLTKKKENPTLKELRKKHQRVTFHLLQEDYNRLKNAVERTQINQSSILRIAFNQFDFNTLPGMN